MMDQIKRSLDVLKKNRTTYSVQVFLELFFIISVFFSISVFGTILMETAVNLADIVGSANLEEMDRGELMKLAEQKPELDKNLETFGYNLFYLIASIFLSYILFKGACWFMTLKAMKKTKFRLFVKNFLVLNIVLFPVLLILLMFYINTLFYLGFLLPSLAVDIFFLAVFIVFGFFAVLCFSNLGEKNVKDIFIKAYEKCFFKFKYHFRNYMILIIVLFIMALVVFLLSLMGTVVAVLFSLVSYVMYCIWSRVYVILI